MVRFERAIDELVEKGRTDPVKLRDGDYWLEFAENFNIIAEKIQNQSKPHKVEEKIMAEVTEIAVSLDPAISASPGEQAKSGSIPEVMPITEEVTTQNIYSDLSI